MPLTPNKLVNRQNTVSFEFAGEKVHLTYSPNALNDEKKMQVLTAIQTRVKVAQAADEAGALPSDEEAAIEHDFAEWFCDVITSWDYVEDSEDDQPGSMVPLAPERIALEIKRFGDFITRCAVEAVTDYQQSKNAGTASPAR